MVHVKIWGVDSYYRILYYITYYSWHADNGLMFGSTTVFTGSYNFLCFCFYTSSGGPTLARGSWCDFSVKTNFNYCDRTTCSTWGMFQKWDISAAGSVARVHPEPTAAIFVLFSLSWENRVLWDWYLTHCGGVEETMNFHLIASFHSWSKNTTTYFGANKLVQCH